MTTNNIESSSRSNRAAELRQQELRQQELARQRRLAEAALKALQEASQARQKEAALAAAKIADPAGLAKIELSDKHGHGLTTSQFISRLETPIKSDTANNFLPSLRLTDLSASHPQVTDALLAAAVRGKNNDFGNPATEQPATMSTQAAQKAAQELRQAIHNQGFWGASPDTNKVLDVLQPLNQADTQAVEKAYQQTYGKTDNNALLDDLKCHLADQQYRQAQSMLNRHDGRTNDAGNVMVALTLAGSDQSKGNALLRQTFEQLNTSQIQQLKTDFQKDYGESLSDAIARDKNLSPDTLKALPFLEKGIEHRTTSDEVTLARLAVQNGDLNLFGEALNGYSPAAQQARRALQSDQSFMSQFIDTFTKATPATYGRFGETSPAETPTWDNADPVAKDFLTQGSISLATIARGDTGHLLGFLNNDANLSLAAINASPTERQQYAQGMQLADSKSKPSNAADQQALDYYKQIHQAFENGGNGMQVSIWQDQLLHGRSTIVTQLTGAHDGGVGPFHWNAHTDTNQLMTMAENLPQQDWQILHDPKTRKQFLAEISSSMSTYASPAQTDQVIATLSKKADAVTYADSQDIKRNLYQYIQGSTGDTKAIDNRITSITPEDAHRYQKNAAYRAEVDDFVSKNMSGDQRTYAQMLLSQVAKTGKPSNPTAPEQILADEINGASNSQTYADIRTALSDSQFRALMNKPNSELKPQDQAVKSALTGGLFKAAASLSVQSTGGRFPTTYASPDSAEFQQNILAPMLAYGKLSPAVEIQMGLPKTDVYADIASASPADQKAALALLNRNEMAIAVNVIKQKGNLALADQIESYLIGDGGSYQQFKAPLASMSPAQLEALKSEFAKKYGTDLDQAFLSKVSDADQQTYSNLLTTDSQDGRQDFYNNLLKMNFSGFSADGTQLTAEKATELEQSALAQYQSEHKKLPPELQQQLDQYFGTAMDQYKESKAKLAEITIDAAITAAALAAAPFSGGMSLAAIGAIAAGGAAFRVGAMEIIEGSDFDGSTRNLLEQSIIGGTSAALNFIGPGLFKTAASMEEVALNAVVDAASSALTSTGDSALSDTAKAALRETVQAGLKKGTLSEETVTALIYDDHVATGAAKKAAKAAIDVFSQQSAAIAESLSKTATAQAAAAAAKDYGNQGHLPGLLKSAGQNALVGGGANGASDLVEAPFNPNGINGKQLLTSTLTGAAAGAIFGAVLEGGKEAMSSGLFRSGEVIPDRSPATPGALTLAPGAPPPESGTAVTAPSSVLRNGDQSTVDSLAVDSPQQSGSVDESDLIARLKRQAPEPLTYMVKGMHTITNPHEMSTLLSHYVREDAYSQPGFMGIMSVTPGSIRTDLQELIDLEVRPGTRKAWQTALDNLEITPETEDHFQKRLTTAAKGQIHWLVYGIYHAMSDDEIALLSRLYKQEFGEAAGPSLRRQLDHVPFSTRSLWENAALEMSTAEQNYSWLENIAKYRGGGIWRVAVDRLQTPEQVRQFAQLFEEKHPGLLERLTLSGESLEATLSKKPPELANAWRPFLERLKPPEEGSEQALAHANQQEIEQPRSTPGRSETQLIADLRSESSERASSGTPRYIDYFVEGLRTIRNPNEMRTLLNFVQEDSYLELQGEDFGVSPNNIREDLRGLIHLFAPPGTKSAWKDALDNVKPLTETAAQLQTRLELEARKAGNGDDWTTYGIQTLGYPDEIARFASRYKQLYGDYAGPNLRFQLDMLRPDLPIELPGATLEHDLPKPQISTLGATEAWRNAAWQISTAEQNYTWLEDIATDQGHETIVDAAVNNLDTPAQVRQFAEVFDEKNPGLSANLQYWRTIFGRVQLGRMQPGLSMKDDALRNAWVQFFERFEPEDERIFQRAINGSLDPESSRFFSPFN